MKPELSALVMPVSSASQADQLLLDREPGQDLPVMRNEGGCLNDANSTFNDPGIFKDSYRGRTIGLRDSSLNRRIYHAAPSVITKKKRFG
ncbi:hypothetical protein C8R32_103251 [Nitrosospira sp. Nsp5]|uniref:Uncharacterized protein n=1 Tax=Nitrosospira multiformis TaxID=1231 RepID=A0ABY0T5G9_9PROT|nr:MULTISPECIES: hypothetical protein [Nitrosospira]PTR09632.1 hypothetical protein C8R32_103251 [Nitrosospira sp. Nsp5]SDQ25775.1 hypothetical protein SAMN05216402_0048 [Nitrosospira multiformis]